MTDVISEVFGESRANLLVKIGFAVSIFAFFILLIANYVPIAKNSPVGNKSFQDVFGFTPVIIFSSMLAYLTAQFVDVKLFELVRKLTKGKYLWLRNNISTIFS